MATVKTYAAGRLLNMPGNKARLPGMHTIGSGGYERGELVPEAHLILRLDSFLHSGHLDEVEVEEDEFRAAIAQYCPEQEAEILARVGLDPPAVLHGTESTPIVDPDANPPASIEELANAGQLGEQDVPEDVCPVCGRVFKNAAGVATHRAMMHAEDDTDQSQPEPD